ncbi:hypothetical protein H7K34_20265 [Mycobacterium montefiorense]|nr:hypothetical protein [Mycobacterium montefiorense]
MGTNELKVSADQLLQAAVQWRGLTAGLSTAAPPPGQPFELTTAAISAVDTATGVRYGTAFYTGMAVLFLALFVLNACTRGTMLGLISTGGLAVSVGYLAYRAWSRKRRTNQPWLSPPIG